MKEYSDELLNMELCIEMLDGIKPLKAFFAITEESLRDVYHVLPTDSFEEARKKIIDVVTKDDFLYDFFNKDPRSWEIKNFDTGYWSTPAKEEHVLTKEELEELGYSEEEINKMSKPVKETKVIQTVQDKLTVKFAKRKPTNAYNDEKYFELYEKEFEDFLANSRVLTDILENKIASKPQKASKKRLDPVKMLVIPDVELHLGKLASKFDSTDSYEYKKALYRYMNIILDAEKVQDKYNAKTICMTIGNDFFNTDTEQNTTTAGTEQHNDTRFQQMIENGIAAHVWAVDRMKQKCDKLIIKFNPGNHDYLTDYTLFMQLYYKYRDDPKVEIDGKVKNSRWATAVTFGNSLIVFAHGKTPEGKALNDEKLSLIPGVMFKNDIKNVKYVYVLAGHLHRASEHLAANGVDVLRNGSPAGDGAWDSGNLYSSDKSHQVYLYDYYTGLDSIHKLKISEEDLEKGISLPPITDDTDYIRALEDSMESNTDKIIISEIKKLNADNEREIRSIEKKYNKLIKKIDSILEDVTLTEEQKKSILSVIGQDEELAPLLENRERLAESLSSREKKLTMKKKPY